MCAIMGFFPKKTYTKEELLPFFDRTRSRGPDMSQILETPSGWLCFHRLAIMGLTEAGMQPFRLGSSAVVCNGEIYGFAKLRAELEGKGYAFSSGSDCEVLLPLYREYGAGMFRLLDAEFALILYDGERDEFLAARDPIGIRPLYYGYDRAGTILFASEPKKPGGAVRDGPALPARLLLPGRAVPPLPGHDPRWNTSAMTTWTPPAASSATSWWPGVEKRLVADAQVGFLLSGGLDSSLVCAIAARKSAVPHPHLCHRHGGGRHRPEVRQAGGGLPGQPPH